MKRFLLSLACILPIAACTTAQVNNAEQCGLALAMSGVALDPAALAIAAASIPACQALAADALASVIAQVPARRAAMRRL